MATIKKILLIGYLLIAPIIAGVLLHVAIASAQETPLSIKPSLFAEPTAETKIEGYLKTIIQELKATQDACGK